MTLLETAEEISRDARQPNASDPPVVARLLACDKSGTDEIIHETTRRRARPADRGGDLTDGRFATIGNVVHRDELREGQLASTELLKGGQQELRRERG